MAATVAAVVSRPVAARLPLLDGSPAQIRWAEDIRRRLLTGIDRNIRDAEYPARAQAFRSTREWLLAHTSAAWWIENRNYKPTTVTRVRNAEILDVYGAIFGTRKPVRRAL